MKKTIRIDTEARDNRRAVLVDDIPSHHLTDDALESLMKESGKGLWKTDPAIGAQIGKQLFEMLSGSGRKLESFVNEAYKAGEPLEIHLNIPYQFSAIPFELLRNNDFLLQRQYPGIHIIRKVSDRNRRQQLPIGQRLLNILFMACSPKYLKENDILQFEKEEERIFASVEKLHADIVIEDSGSLPGLTDAIIEGGGRYDVVHITGHANIEHGAGPVFYMENDIGLLHKVTPDALYSAIRDFPPRLLFLSGCLTGKTDNVSGAESFAFQMNEKGIPFVLGWGLPVSDIGATRLTTEFYRNLSMGKSLADALSLSRQAIKEDYRTWCLLRLFSDGSPLLPMIKPGQKLRHQTPRKTAYKYLADSHIRVLEKGFVARRREIQTGMRVLKGIGEPKFAPMIRGPAGIGKSCLSAKLIERFSDHDLIAIHGKLTAADLIIHLHKLFDKKGNSIGLEILEQDMKIGDKLKALFRKAFENMPLILYLDDFEQNLETGGEPPFILNSQAFELFAPILTAFDWSNGNVKLIISSRYPFILENFGENLADKLADITLASFQDADLDKKIPGLYYPVYPGIREGSAIRKTDLNSLKTELRYFITDRPAGAWDAQSIADRILLHRDTGTGVSGIRDNTFHEDRVRYKSVSGAMSHADLLNSARNCLSAPAFGQYRRGEPVSCRMQFRKDHPGYNPLKS